VYPDERVARFVAENFIPARIHVRDQAADFQRFGERYGAQWTPTILELDPSGEERHRIEGFLPTEDFLPQLALGLGHMAFKRNDYATAERHFRTIVARHPESESAAEAMYWAGVARYKATNDPAALAETTRSFTERHQNTTWAKKASVWRG
jgi:uncharacterized protein HemY